MKLLLQKHATKLRFGLIGGINTTIDIGLLFIFANAFGVPEILANIFSTSSAFIFSFFANKTFTFKSHGKKNIVHEMVLFTIITLFGLWVIQGILLYLLVPVIENIGLNKDLSLLVAKLIATVASLTWNYILYSKIVFRVQEEPTSSSEK